MRIKRAAVEVSRVERTCNQPCVQHSSHIEGYSPLPMQDYQFLHDSGVYAVYGPGTRIPVAARAIIGALDAQLGAA
eukprot:3324688-Pleurochrysis_carterae.AAC.2